MHTTLHHIPQHSCPHLSSCLDDMPSLTVFQATQTDPTSYEKELQLKLAKLRDLVKTNIVQAATYQKAGYDHQTRYRTFTANDFVWLLIPQQGKLSSK